MVKQFQKKQVIKNKVKKKVNNSKSKKSGNRMFSNIPQTISLDPMSAQHHGRAAHRVMPYTVIREKILIPGAITPSAGALYILGSFSNSAGQVPICAVGGSTGPVATTLTSAPIRFASNLLSTDTVCRVRLHRIAVTVSTTGTTNAGGTPDGLVYIGTLRTPLDYTSFANFAGVANYALSREEITQRSSMACMFNPARYTSYPLDTIAFDQFVSMNSSLPGTPSLDNSLAPIVVYIPATVNTNNVSLTVHCEWCVEYTGNDPVLQSTAKVHPVAPNSVWDTLGSMAMNVSGAVSTGVSMVDSVLHVGGMAQRGFQGLAARAPLALG